MSIINNQILAMQEFPNICGIDLGSWTIKVSAMLKNRHFEILTNEANFRETPSVVGFSESQRFIGEQGLNKMKSNYRNTLRSPIRLIGLSNRKQIIEEELRYCAVPFRYGNEQVKFNVMTSQGEQEIDGEQFLIAQLQKAKQIVESHGLGVDRCFISVPPYFGSPERKAVKICAEAACLVNVGLVESWEAIASEYYFFRKKQLQKENENRVIVLVDFGYCTFSAYACAISKEEMRLLDYSVLRYTGSRNMDYLLAEFYVQMFEKQCGQDINSNKKALVKLFDNIEQQKKKLSANLESSINIECLMGDHDLSYNMKREELENIVMPVLGELATALQNLRLRVEPIAKITSVEVLGGASRMPFFQEIVKNIFAMEISKTLNSGQALGRGVVIAGMARMTALSHRPLKVIRTLPYEVYCCIHSLSQEQPFAKNIDKYNLTHKKIVWKSKEQLPLHSMTKINSNAVVEAILFYEQGLNRKVIGYFKFKGDDTLTLSIDIDRTIHAKLNNKSQFICYDTGDYYSLQKIVRLKQTAVQMLKNDQQVQLSYELRNNYESLIYSSKENIHGNWHKLLTAQQTQYLSDITTSCQQWLNEYTHESNASQQIRQRIHLFNEVIHFVQQRVKNYEMANQLLNKIIEFSSKYRSNKQMGGKLQKIKEEVDALVEKEEQSYWKGEFINLGVFNQVMGDLNKG